MDNLLPSAAAATPPLPLIAAATSAEFSIPLKSTTTAAPVDVAKPLLPAPSSPLVHEISVPSVDDTLTVDPSAFILAFNPIPCNLVTKSAEIASLSPVIVVNV